MDVMRSAQPPDGGALFPCIGVDDRNGAVAFVGGVGPRGGQEVGGGAGGEEKGERSSPEGHHIKFMNLVLASSMMASVTWAAPRSAAIRSISRRAIGRMKSGMFSRRFSAAGAHGMPSVAFFESSMTWSVIFV